MMLKAKDIYKKFGDIEVLKGVDLDVKKSEIVSVVGASGAGKSTLLQILGTLDRPDRGEIYIDDVEISSLNDKKLSAFRNQKIGFVFQFHHLLPEFTALENVLIPAYLREKTISKPEKKARDLLQLLGLKHRIDHKPSALSGGEQQRVAVARALINDPAILFADEPSGNLDSKNSGELHELFLQLRDELEQTFVIVTHNKELADLADRKLTMRDGQIIN